MAAARTACAGRGRRGIRSTTIATWLLSTDLRRLVGQRLQQTLSLLRGQPTDPALLIHPRHSHQRRDLRWPIARNRAKDLRHPGLFASSSPLRLNTPATLVVPDFTSANSALRAVRAWAAGGRR